MSKHYLAKLVRKARAQKPPCRFPARGTILYIQIIPSLLHSLLITSILCGVAI